MDEPQIAITESINEEQELILVDECSHNSSNSDSNPYDTSAIEMMANNAPACDSPISRFNGSIDPLTEAVYGVAMCAVRFPAYFKPLYRLAKTLYIMGYPLVSQLL